MEFFWWVWGIYTVYLSLKCLIKMALWSWWFEARNRSTASPERVLTKLFNIQLTKIKNLFSNDCFCLARRSLWVGGGSYYDVQMKESMSYLDTGPWSLCAGGCSPSQNADAASFWCWWWVLEYSFQLAWGVNIKRNLCQSPGSWGLISVVLRVSTASQKRDWRAPYIKRD